MTSRVSGFHRLTVSERRAIVRRETGIDRDLWDSSLSQDAAALMTENAVGLHAFPASVAVNFTLNGRDLWVPMVVEEPSVVAAVSHVGLLAREGGGFHASADDSVMIGQVQLPRLRNAEATAAKLRAALPDLAAFADGVHPNLARRGGGMRGMEVRVLRFDHPEEAPEDMVVLHFFLDCADAMGANLVNTVAEALAAPVEAVTGERVGLRILSNYATRRLARAEVRVPWETLGGEPIAEGIASAWRFAWADPYRATTHNKGLMNGIDAVALATGNDWRAIEAGAHAWAARDGQYRPLTRWTSREGHLHGQIELPIQVGVVGGPIRVHPTVQDALAVLGQPSARQLAAILAAVGLAQNLGALRALAAEGIQRGHMRMHARNVAAAAGARGPEVEAVVAEMATRRDYQVQAATEILAALRGT